MNDIQLNAKDVDMEKVLLSCDITTIVLIRHGLHICEPQCTG